MIRKIIASLIPAVMLTAGISIGVSADENISISGKESDGEYVIKVSAASDIVDGAEVNIYYPSDDVKIKNADKGSMFDNAFVSKFDADTPGRIKAVFMNTSAVSKGNIITAVFEVGNASGEIEVSGSYTKTDDTDAEYTEIFKFGSSSEAVPTSAPTATKKPSSGGGSSVSVTAVPTSTTTADPTASPTAAPSENNTAISYIDIDNHWAKTEISALSKKGLVNGFADNTFRPGENVTRAQFAKMIIEAKNISADKYIRVFNDVNENDWFANYVSAAYEAGIIKGDENGSFNPQTNITRQEMAVIAVRAFEIGGGEYCTFEDKTDISSWAEAAVAAASNAGIITGMENNMFKPADNASRAQAAVIIYRLINR